MAVLRLLLAAWVALAGALLAAPAAQAKSSDDTARATFLILLGKYVTWPAGAFASPTAPIVVAVVGNPALVDELQALARGQQIDGRAVEVRSATDAAAAAGAHIVFVSDAAQSNELAKARPLRVSDRGRLADTDIAIRMEAGRVAFAVNRRDVERRGLKLSSKLMRLASSFD